MTQRVKKLGQDRLTFFCPGCNMTHTVAVGSGSGPRWNWNDDFDTPTLSPSVLVTYSLPSDDPSEFDDPAKDVRYRCHSFVRDGRIQFLGDCTHSLANQTVLLPEQDG